MIKSQVSDTIKNYGDNAKVAEDLDTPKFIKEIDDDTDVSILGNNIHKDTEEIDSVLSSKATYTVKFNTTLHHYMMVFYHFV